MTTLYNIQEAPFPNKIAVSTSQQMATKLSALKIRYTKWKQIKIEKFGITVREYPKNYFKDWLFKKKDSKYIITGTWANRYRKQFNLSAKIYII